jgi:hypothetical protein
MNLVNSYPSIIKTLRYLEWSFLTVHIVMDWNISNFKTNPEHFGEILVFLVAFMILSWIYPVNRP